MIEVERVQDGDPMVFDVAVRKGPGESQHEVTVPEADHERLGPDATPEALVEASFEFLLDREPKESILSSFEITVINRYFPEYEEEISSYL